MASKEKARLLLYVKLAVIQGLTWSTGFMAILTGWSVSWYIFTVFNGLQGVFIFIFFDMKQKVLRVTLLFSLENAWMIIYIYIYIYISKLSANTMITHSFR